MAPREYAPITPAVLKWAREAAGYTVDDVAAKLKTARGRVLAWESGTEPLPVGRLDRLAKIYKRPTALFYMPAPPPEEEVGPRDFRDAPLKVSPELTYQIRLAHERCAAALDLLEELDGRAPRFEFTCKESERPNEAGARLRNLLAVSVAEQESWWGKDRSGYTACNAWKAAAEKNGVLVFQASKRNMDGARGFSLHAGLMPAVVLSSDDAPTGRAFTLIHELAHLGLREGGLCDLHERGVEAFCNKVAAAVLMPERELRVSVARWKKLSKDGVWPDEPLTKMANTFSVSLQALVLRLVEIGEATAAFYKSKLPEFRARAAQAKSESGFVPPHVLAIAHNGREFTRLVVDAYHRGAITEHRASTYLRISHEQLPKVVDDMMRYALKRAS
ncbi:ImmA/IrrE family metallo-endopeptidase [Sorangium sp. So ce381]|uniref:ImmA/IrrE family metallo-endopeptidase n=1 Tax=Sorangium sp. So ce381 TaxID=3133307 RepID=UPI003F5B0163